jgi:predicted transcriptional regulator YheO
VNKSTHHLVAGQINAPANRAQTVAQVYGRLVDKPSIKQVAEMFGISPYTVRRYLKKASRQQQKGGQTR